MRAKAAEMTGMIGASLPPARTMSHTPDRISAEAVPIAVVPEAQAVETVRLGPVAPHMSDNCPGSMFGAYNGTVVAETFSPRSRRSTCSFKVDTPPKPVPITTPTRVPSHCAGSNSAMVKASAPATKASWL